jgi:cytochrome P450
MEFVKNLVQFLKVLLQKNKGVRRLGITLISIMTMYYIRKLYWHFYCRIHHLPNGIRGLPFVGIVFAMGINEKKFLNHTCPKHGPIAIFNMLGTKGVMINDWKLAKFVLHDNRILNRPPLVENAMTINNVLTGSGEEWAQDRRIFINALTKIINRSYLLQLANQLLKENLFVTLDEHIANNELWSCYLDLRNLSFNVIFAAMFGVKIKSDDPFFNEFMKLFETWNQNRVFYVLISVLVPEFVKKYVNFRQNYIGAYEMKIYKLLDPLIQQSIDTYDESKIELWFHHMLQDIGYKGDKNISNETRHKLAATTLVAVGAGMETTAHTMEYAMLTLTKYPKYQQLLYDELLEVYKNKENFDLSKINECHMHRAFIHEALRCSIPAPTGGYHSSNVPIEIKLTKDNVSQKYSKEWNKTYVIPKDYFYMFNFTTMCESETSPFDIENFLKYDNTSKRKVFSQNPNVFPFGAGKRSCAGELIAVQELYYVIALLILHYKFSCDHDFTITIETHGLNRVTSKIGISVLKR